MSSTPRVLFTVTLAGVAGLLGAAPAATPPSPPSPFSWSGDVRVRYESDWDSVNSAGVPRESRERLRGRARVNLGYQWQPAWSLGVRVRTGASNSQQGAHLTAWSSDEVTDDFEGTVDRYFVQYKQGEWQGWLGRISHPVWQVSELLWDEDLTPLGGALTRTLKAHGGKWALAGGAYALPEGANHFHGHLATAQVRHERALGSGTWTIASDVWVFDGESKARYLRNRNGERDYLIGRTSTQWTSVLPDQTPFSLGAEVFYNFQNYSAAERAPYSSRHEDERLGLGLLALVGSAKKKGDIQCGYGFARVETFAANASFAQDDWARFGSGGQADLTDLRGHELRLVYALSPVMNLTARAFFVEALTSMQDGKRLRVDFNWRF